VESIRAVLTWSVFIGWETSVIPQPCSVGFPDHVERVARGLEEGTSVYNHVVRVRKQVGKSIYLR